MRIDISAAAALVKVRHRMRDGWGPASIRRSTRSVSTLVLPVPAEAPTQTEHSGSDARRCLTLGSIAREARSTTLIPRSSFNRLPATGGPFLYAGKMAVVGVARRPVRPWARPVGGGGIVESADQVSQAGAGLFG